MGTINAISPHSRTAPSQSKGGLHLGTLLLAVVRRIDQMDQRRRSRIALQELSDEQLKDIGISRADAFREAARPFWD